jgi:S1-C subfamily serine protease
MKKTAYSLATLAILCAGALALPATASDGQVSPLHTVARPASLVADVVSRAAQSVYMLGIENGNGGFVHAGTGWVVAPGRLATNAHVAEVLLAAEAGARVVAKRSWSAPGLLVEAGSIQLHPTYVRWDELFTGASIQGSEQGLVSPADLALLDVEGVTGPPLTLSAVSADAMGLGDQVLYIGYPHESRAGRPTRQVVLGNITAVSDVFFEDGAWEDARLIHVSLAVCGGASGSPLLNMYGEVIGVMSASDHVHSAFSNRVPFGFGYAQRVDFLREFLDGVADGEFAARDEQWESVLGHNAPEQLVFEDPDGFSVEERLEGMTERVELMLDGQGRELAKVDERVVTTSSPWDRTVIHIEAGVIVTVMAVEHDGRDIDLAAYDADEALVEEDSALDHYPVVVLGPFTEAQEVTVVLQSPSFFGTTCTSSVRTIWSSAPAADPADVGGK